MIGGYAKGGKQRKVGTRRTQGVVVSRRQQERDFQHYNINMLLLQEQDFAGFLGCVRSLKSLGLGLSEREGAMNYLFTYCCS